MKVYLVGGAVRDQLLGLPVKEKDWVVVGATVGEMVAANYKQVGKSFPVFLHPQTNEEYALARTEQKVAAGYTGFNFNATQSVTLEEDLMRRDLTINAIAQTDDGQYIDPYHGIDDLKAKVLRHVSPAFVEDPVRLLRVARFSAQFAHLGFTVAPETRQLMQHMVHNGEVNALVPERVWAELSRALLSATPSAFFDVLSACLAMPVLFPEIKDYSALLEATALTDDVLVRFAALFKGASESDILTFCRRYRTPKAQQDLALLCCRQQKNFIGLADPSAEMIVDLLQACDAFRRESRFIRFLQASQVLTNASPTLGALLTKAYQVCQLVKIDDVLAQGQAGQEVAKLLHDRRVIAINTLLKRG